MQRMHCLFVSTRSILFFSSTFIAASSLAYSRSIAAPFPWTFQTSPKPPIGCDGRICTCVPPPPLGSDDRSHHASTLLAKTPCKCPKNKKKSRTSGYAQHRIESIRPNARARLRSPRCVEAWNAWHEACVRGNTRISHTTSINHSPAAELESASASIAGSLSYNSAVFGHPFLASFFSNCDDARGARRSGNQVGPASHIRTNSRQPIFLFTEHTTEARLDRKCLFQCSSPSHPRLCNMASTSPGHVLLPRRFFQPTRLDFPLSRWVGIFFAKQFWCALSE